MDNQTQKPKGKQISKNGLLYYSGMGMQLLAIIGVCTIAGVFLDKQLGWGFPIFTIVFSLSGVLGGMFSIIRKL